MRCSHEIKSPIPGSETTGEHGQLHSSAPVEMDMDDPEALKRKFVCGGDFVDLRCCPQHELKRNWVFELFQLMLVGRLERPIVVGFDRGLTIYQA
jgi:hypothetical protein